MTDEILQTDIDLARRLIDEGDGDAEIIGHLARRNISPERATRLVSDLRAGQAVEPDHVWRAVSSRSARTASLAPSSRSGSEARRNPAPLRVPWFRILVALAVAVCIGFAAWTNHKKNLRAAEANSVAGISGV